VTASIPLGRIFGIRIGINWSWLVVFALIAWTLASGIFPDTNPGLRHGTYVWMAIVASTLFFASLLLHELGHAVQARREGMEIEGITLWLFGGVAKFKGMFPSAGAEFRIAIAGPLVSLALGLLFALGAWAVSTREAVDSVAAWLGYINLTLLVFNMLPALPLDGGRVLRSAPGTCAGAFAGRCASPLRSGARSASCSSPPASSYSSFREPSAVRGSPSSAGSCSRRPRQRIATCWSRTRSATCTSAS
jgi:Zn-dependent protease